MKNILLVYLPVTGILALLALAMPSLVIIGTVALILPGVILMLAPTAFLWGCIFTAPWLFMRGFAKDAVAVPVALAVLATTVWTLPIAYQRQAERQMGTYALADVTPKAPIRPEGDVRIDEMGPRWDRSTFSRSNIGRYQPLDGLRTYACDARCIALLFEPGVRSVTVNASGQLSFEQVRDGTGPLDKPARTFRLLKRGECWGGGYDPDTGNATLSSFGRTMADNKAISADWQWRLATEVCLDSRPPLQKHDMLIRIGTWQEGPRAPAMSAPWSLESSPIGGSFAEIRNAQGTVLMRSSIPDVEVLSVPFMIGVGGGMENFHFRWSRQSLRKVTEPRAAVAKILEDSLAIRRTASPAKSPAPSSSH